MLFSTTPNFPFSIPFHAFLKIVSSNTGCCLDVSSCLFYFLFYFSLQLTLHLCKSGVNIHFGHGFLGFEVLVLEQCIISTSSSSPQCIWIFFELERGGLWDGLRLCLDSAGLHQRGFSNCYWWQLNFTKWLMFVSFKNSMAAEQYTAGQVRWEPV